MEIQSAPLVSVILTTYNPNRQWVLESINSILSQTYKNIEFIIIDDWSNNWVLDELYLILSNQFSNLIVIKNEENKWVSYSSNKALKLSSWKYIARIDDDDIWSDNYKLEEQVNFLENNKDYGLVGTWCHITDEDWNILYSVNNPTNHEDMQDKMISKCYFPHSSVLYVKDVVLSAWGYNHIWFPIDDHDLRIKISMISKVANLPLHWMKYRHKKSWICYNNMVKLHIKRFKLTLHYQKKRGKSNRFILKRFSILIKKLCLYHLDKLK